MWPPPATLRHSPTVFEDGKYDYFCFPPFITKVSCAGEKQFIFYNIVLSLENLCFGLKKTRGRKTQCWREKELESEGRRER